MLTAKVLCHVRNRDGSLNMGDPRNVLRRVVQAYAEKGLGVLMFSELEFFLVDEVTGKPIDNAGYLSPPPLDAAYRYRRELCRILEDVGVKVCMLLSSELHVNS
mgnify:CR=1 FL=1